MEREKLIIYYVAAVGILALAIGQLSPGYEVHAANVSDSGSVPREQIVKLTWGGVSPARRHESARKAVKVEEATDFDFHLSRIDLRVPMFLTVPWNEKGYWVLPAVNDEAGVTEGIRTGLADWKNKPKFLAWFRTEQDDHFVGLCHSFRGKDGQPLPCEGARKGGEEMEGEYIIIRQNTPEGVVTARYRIVEWTHHDEPYQKAGGQGADGLPALVRTDVLEI